MHATAIPAGGKIGDAYPGGTASISASLPVAIVGKRQRQVGEAPPFGFTHRQMPSDAEHLATAHLSETAV
jgi:hypothetical protein